MIHFKLYIFASFSFSKNSKDDWIARIPLAIFPKISSAFYEID